jgi:hypothetical protein
VLHRLVDLRLHHFPWIDFLGFIDHIDTSLGQVQAQKNFLT